MICINEHRFDSYGCLPPNEKQIMLLKEMEEVFFSEKKFEVFFYTILGTSRDCENKPNTHYISQKEINIYINFFYNVIELKDQ